MKSSVLLAGLVSGTMATYWNQVPTYSRPGNCDNKCVGKQPQGWSWDDVKPGDDVTQYDGYDFGGFKCRDNNKTGRRDLLIARTSGRSIRGSCSSDKGSSPYFRSGDGKKPFSVDKFDVYTEFDADLEFHYDMPGGGSCKQRAKCSRSGTSIQNKQCGGATGVTITYPKQPGKNKPTCEVDIGKIDFDCKPPEPSNTYSQPPPQKTTTTPIDEEGTTVPGTTVPGTTAETTTAETTSSAPTPPEQTYSQPPEGTTSTVPVEGETTTVPPKEETSAEETTPVKETSAEETTYAEETTPVDDVTSTYGQPGTTYPAEEGTTTVPAEGFTSSEEGEKSSTASEETPSSLPPTYETVSEGEGTTTVVEGTTTAPVTPPESTATTTATTSVGEEEATSSAPGSSYVTVPGSTLTTATGTGSTTSVKPPQETLPCPDVVPGCVGTWVGRTECKDASDVDCFCKDGEFIKNVYGCIYAHSGDDDTVAQGAQYLQGLCAAYAPENPAVVTCVNSVTSALTTTSTYTIPGQSTTVVVTATYSDAGTTSVVTSTATVPQVALTSTEGGVVVVPGESTAAPGYESGPDDEAGNAVATPSTTAPPVYAGAGKNTAVGFGFMAVLVLMM